MQQLLLHGSDATGKQCTLALPHSKWFRRLRKDGLPNPPIIPLVQFDSCSKTYPFTVKILTLVLNVIRSSEGKMVWFDTIKLNIQQMTIHVKIVMLASAEVRT